MNTCQSVSGEFIKWQDVIVHGGGEMHKELDCNAITEVNGELYLPVSCGSTVKGRLGQCVDFWRDELVALP